MANGNNANFQLPTMNKTVYVHIGPPKTGTTAIQETLALNRPALLAQGIFTPDEVNHTSVFNHFSARHNVKPQQQAILDEFFQALRGEQHTLLVSSEFFSGYQQPEFSALRQFFFNQGVRVKVIAYIRHPLTILISARQEMLKKGLTFAQLETMSLGMRYSNLCKRLLEVFSEDELIFKKFSGSEDKSFDVIQDFLGIIQVELSNLGKVRKNRSLSLEAALMLDWLNGHPGLDHGKRQSLLKTLRKLRGQPFVLPAAEIQKLQPIVAYELQWLQTHLGIDFAEFAPVGFTDAEKNLILARPEAQALLAGLEEPLPL